MDNSFFSSMTDQAHAFLFAGQSTPWAAALNDVKNNEEVMEQLKKYDSSSQTLLQPVATDLLTIYGHRLDLFSYASSSWSWARPNMPRPAFPELFWPSWLLF